MIPILPLSIPLPAIKGEWIQTSSELALHTLLKSHTSPNIKPRGQIDVDLNHIYTEQFPKLTWKSNPQIHASH
jgi:hypothetical protein